MRPPALRIASLARSGVPRLLLWGALALAASIALLPASGHAAPAPAESASPPPRSSPDADAASTPSVADAYREAATRLIGEALLSRDAYDRLAVLCDRVGHRLSGSPQLDSAIVWAVETMRAGGLANVHTEPVTVPVWVRGEERAWLLEPARHDLTILGLGMSVGTPEGGIEADMVVVGSFAEVDSLGEAGIRGRIVLYDVPYTTYGETVRYRSSGASHAARYGAAAILLRSVTPVSFDTPHTGALSYNDSLPQIPAAAVTIEGATMMRRMAERGERIRAHLEMRARRLPDAPSANVVGEVVGSERPDEIVLLAAHLDSWDVGQGAQDDGVGCVLAMEAARLIRRLDLRPRRTVRVVLFTNEENGLAGGKAYRDAHKDELSRCVAAIETDSGNGIVQGFRLDVRPRKDAADTAAARTEAEAAAQRGLVILRDLGALLEPLGPMTMRAAGSGADVGPSVAEGVVGLGVEHDIAHYFDVHHSPADTFEKIDAETLAKNAAAVAVAAFVVADMPGRLPRAETHAAPTGTR